MLIDDYRNYLLDVEGKSLGTIKQYYTSIKMFIQYMQENEFPITRKNMVKVKLSNIYGFMNSLAKNESNGTKRNKISALKSYFEYCKTIDVIKHNIIIDIKKQPKKIKRIAKCFTLEECKKLVDNVSGRNKERDKMIIILFLNTGLRLEELVKLNIYCIENQNINIIGKEDKERVVHLDSTVLTLLKEYIEKVRPKSKKELNALFLSERLTRISCRTVQTLVNNAISNAGLNVEGKNDMSVHALRHTFATLQFQNGVSIRTLQKILGHEDISTTQIYIQVADNQMIEAAKTNPLLTIF